MWGQDPTPVYFNDFSSTEGLTIVGSGEFIDDGDTRFGQIYHNNPAANTARRSNYLLLPENVLTHSGTSNQMTIGFWVNRKADNDYYFCPLFSAYGSTTPGEANGMPMFICQSRGLLQVNARGWSDFTDANNDNSSNAQSTAWLDDNAWHYYTVTLTSTEAIVYVDGAVVNSWTMDGTSDGQVIAGLFSAGAANELPKVCLGGNQAWGWDDKDASFGFDDFAVYDVALTPAQIAKVIEDKLNSVLSVPSSFALNAAEAANPFPEGTITTGTNVTALNVNNTTATAWFDGNATDDGNQPYELSENETVTVSFTAYHGWLGSGADQGVKIINSEGYTLAEYKYTLGNCNISDVKIGGSTPATFTGAYNCQSSIVGGKGNANGFTNLPYVTNAGYNPVITFTIGQDGFVTLSIVQPQRGVNNTYTGNLPGGWAVDLQKLQVYSGSNNGDRTIGINNLSITTETLEKHTVTFTYVDEEDNSLTAYRADSQVQALEGDDIATLITSTLTSSFYNGDESVRYDYADDYTVTGDATVVPDGDVTVTLKFTPKNRCAYSVNAIDGESGIIKANIISGIGYAGESVSYYLPECVLVDGTLYFMAAEQSYRSETVTSNNQVFSYPYTTRTVNNAVFFVEGESIAGAATSSTSYQSLVSCGYMGRGSNLTLTTLPVGSYQVFVRYYNSNANAHNVTISAGETEVFNKDFSGRNTQSAEFTLTEEATLKLTAPGSSMSGVDYVYIVRTAVPVTLGAIGWATLYTPYALDFDGTGLTAYTATVAGSTVTLTPVTDVPANTGVVLNGDEGNYNIPTTASSETAKGELTGDAAAATASDAFDGFTLYALAQAEDHPTHQVQFRPVTSGSIAAGKAFLKISGGGVKAFTVNFGDAVAISDVSSKMEDAQSEIFNLAGQRMSKVQKGVNIVNGKKVLVK